MLAPALEIKWMNLPAVIQIEAHVIQEAINFRFYIITIKLQLFCASAIIYARQYMQILDWDKCSTFKLEI